jgi:OHCU decarboxylase
MTSARAPVTSLSRADFVAEFGGVFEHSPWVAEKAFDRGLPADADTVEGLHRTMVAAMRAGSPDMLLALVNAHPDLAGRLARAGRLTADSTKEQASAGLDHLTDSERTLFEALNDDYKERFGFPFIMAVKGRSKEEILTAFEERLAHDEDQEFATALSEIEKIVRLRLTDILG